MFQRWTGDRWHSALHRVVNFSLEQLSPPDNTIQSLSEEAMLSSPQTISRYSLVIFSGPLAEAMIESLDQEKYSEGKKYPPIKSHDHLLYKLNRTNNTD